MAMRRGTVGLLAEVYGIWERRSPLTPQHVAGLVSNGHRVLVQPSTRRVFSDSEYADVGAEITSDLGDASCILGVKQPRTDALLEDKTYAFFSHTIKAQAENMELLDALAAKRCTLVDYECITGDGGARLVAFGEYAGLAGMIGALSALGQRLLVEHGVSSPLLGIAPARYYGTLVDALKAVARAGEKLRRHPLVDPVDGGPLVIAFVGDGRVSAGAQQVFDALGGGAELLDSVDAIAGGSTRGASFLGVVVREADRCARRDGAPFDFGDFVSHGDRYELSYKADWQKRVSLMVNCAYWDERYPRVMPKERYSDFGRLRGIADLGCDVRGSVECLETTTTPDLPCYSYDATNERIVAPHSTQGGDFFVLGVDILPAELPREASDHFGNALAPLVGALSVKPGTLDEWPGPLRSATILDGGELTRNFNYIEKLRAAGDSSSSPAQVEALSPAGSTVVRLDGHLFDSGLINAALDAVEEASGTFALLGCELERAPASGTPKTSMLLQVSVPNGTVGLAALVQTIREEAGRRPRAQAELTPLPDYCRGEYAATIARA